MSAANGLADLYALLQRWGVLLGPAVAWLWVARLQGRNLALQAQSGRVLADDSVARQLGDLVTQIKAERDRTAGLASSYLLELERLRLARYGLEDMVMALRDQALAARALVHELQRRHDLPETLFDPLPYPGLAPRFAEMGPPGPGPPG